ncbi:MAG TPA: hypothetical protein VKT99_02845 [Xanthobacteraceae bacterium]|jgi:hypothetical protein|nr:hypothetical protein [Xanthobacteraceae bacterium]
MLGRSIIVVAGIVAAMPAWAGELKPEEAKRFIAGKYFSYTCFEGTTGAGRINADGSVVGTIQVRGSGPARLIALPTGTIQVRADSICASLRGMLFQPCFNVYQTDAKSFRGSIAGLGFAYCDFTRRNPKLEVSATHPAHARPLIDWDTLRTSVEE